MKPTGGTGLSAMSTRGMRALDAGYVAEFNSVDADSWSSLLAKFDDANIYQTWSYGEVLSGRRGISQFILRHDGEVVALAQARVVEVPIVKVGVAYVRWGPVWRRSGSAGTDSNVFRQAIRALRNEFACRRGLVLRLLPMLFAADSEAFTAILEQEGFAAPEQQSPSRTILMDLRPPLANLRDGMRPHWKRELKLAERHALEIIEGTGDELFETFIGMYKEMVARKKFVEPNDINQFRQIQRALPEPLKMRIMLCRSSAGLCAGLIASAIGDTAIYLFGATSTVGMKSNGSYFLQWKLIEQLQQQGCTMYNLNGINPQANPGTYKFKHDLAGSNGRDVYFVGRFDASGSGLAQWCVRAAERFKGSYKALKQAQSQTRSERLRPKEAR